MADVLLGTMRTSARGDCDRRRAHHLLTRGNNVSTLFDRQRGPRPEGPLRGDTGHHQRHTLVQRTDHAELRLTRLAQGSGPHGDHHIESDVEGTGPSLNQCVAREGGLARFVASQDSATARLELGGRLLDGPFVGPDHEHGRRRRPGLLDRGSTEHGRQPGTPLGSQSCGHVLSVDYPDHYLAYSRSTPSQLGRRSRADRRAVGFQKWLRTLHIGESVQLRYVTRPVVAVAEDDDTVVTNVGTAESVRTAAVPSRSVGKLLVVDDDPEVRGMLSRLLEVEGYKVTEAMTGAEAIGSLSSGQPDLVILDVMLTTEDGFDVLAAIRRTSDVPVILVTAKGHESDRVLGLKLGADDYVVKPFSPAELAARVGTVLRRSGANRSSKASTGTLEFGDLIIDTLAREIRVSDRLVDTTAKEFALLAFLAGSPRQVFTREQLLAQVWDSSSEWQDAGTVTEHIRRIRRKIEVDPDSPRWVRTVRGVGYRFEP
jgi:DNA-binding response OmpR family regulator